jgi:hypothetical protein
MGPLTLWEALPEKGGETNKQTFQNKINIKQSFLQEKKK